MKKTALAVFMSLGLSVPALAEQHAQEQNNKISKVAIEVLCYPHNDPTAVLAEKYGEYPLVIGETDVKDAVAQQDVRGDLTVFLNPKTGTYTIMFESADKQALCMINSGGKMRPARVSGQEM